MRPPKIVHPLFRIALIGVVIFGACWISNDSAFAQGAPSAAPQSKNIWTLFLEGGWIMWPLLLISMWCTALIIECFVRIRIPNFVPLEQLAQLKAAFSEENYQQAWRVCKSKSSFLTNVLCYGLERIGRGRPATESAISEHSLKESMLFRTKISYLSTIGVISPMVGLLGTVTGMIRAFHELGHGGISDPSKLAAAIGEVLIATASGLIVAIPAFFLYYFFRNRLQQVVVMAEDAINQLMVDVKYEELQGIRIGGALENEMAGGVRKPGGAKGPLQPVGAAMACPQCKAPIAAGAPKCASCGTELQWG
jgi:biopolymer transport protein ExbB